MAMKLILAGGLAGAMALSGAGVAAANAAQYVRTQSGAVRCMVDTTEVVCERGGGFTNAPYSDQYNARMNLVAITPSGGIGWNIGNIGGMNLDDDVVLNYGQTYAFNGWTINPSSSGTRFTNNSTGRSVVVTIDGAG